MPSQNRESIFNSNTGYRHKNKEQKIMTKRQKSQMYQKKGYLGNDRLMTMKQSKQADKMYLLNSVKYQDSEYVFSPIKHGGQWY